MSAAARTVRHGLHARSRRRADGAGGRSSGPAPLGRPDTARRSQAASPLPKNGRFYNRMYFVKPSGEFIGYDKRHLSRTRRRSAPVHPATAWWIRLWRRAVPAARLLRFAFSGLEPLPGRLRRHSVLRLVACAARSVADAARARAIENQCYAAGANRVGDDPAARYAGDSALVDFKAARWPKPAAGNEF